MVNVPIRRMPWEKPLPMEVTVVSTRIAVAKVTRAVVYRKHPYQHPKLAKQVKHIQYNGKMHMVLYWADKYSHLCLLLPGTPFICV